MRNDPRTRPSAARFPARAGPLTGWGLAVVMLRVLAINCQFESRHSLVHLCPAPAMMRALQPEGALCIAPNAEPNTATDSRNVRTAVFPSLRRSRRSIKAPGFLISNG